MVRTDSRNLGKVSVFSLYNLLGEVEELTRTQPPGYKHRVEQLTQLYLDRKKQFYRLASQVPCFRQDIADCEAVLGLAPAPTTEPSTPHSFSLQPFSDLDVFNIGLLLLPKVYGGLVGTLTPQEQLAYRTMQELKQGKLRARA